MRVGGFHLTYCSNIHAGEGWPDVRTALGSVLPQVRRHLNWPGPFAIGLRLSAEAGEALAQPAAREEFRRFLTASQHYVFTINGFPYGAFHGQRVKEQVYLPDWRDPRRVAYTNQLASILADLMPDDLPGGSVSTVPGAFKAHLTGPADIEAVAQGIREHARFLHALRERTGRVVRLALEPEPACLLETVAETCDFFDRYLGDRDVREHVGVCVDTCHMAVEFEDPADVISRFTDAGITIAKVQISSALDVSGREAIGALSAFAEDTYLHQVVTRATQELSRFSDLPEALAHAGARSREEWRVHFHVPLFLERLGVLRTTQPFVRAFLKALRAAPVCDQLEVETYTWDVLPEEHRRVDMATAIARELEWVREQLA
jgi:hypothetical protein